MADPPRQYAGDSRRATARAPALLRALDQPAGTTLPRPWAGGLRPAAALRFRRSRSCGSSRATTS